MNFTKFCAILPKEEEEEERLIDFFLKFHINKISILAKKEKEKNHEGI